MQKLVLLIFLLFTINTYSQVDSVLVDSSQMEDNDNYTAVIPYTSDHLESMQVVSKIIQSQNEDNHKSYFFLFILNLLAISAFLLTISRLKVKKMISTLFSLNVLMQYAKVEAKRDNSYLWAYFILFIMFLSALVYVLGLNFQVEIDVLKLTLLIVIFLTLDLLIGFFTAFIFKKEELKGMCHFNNFSYVLVLMPFLIIALLLILFLNIQNTAIASLIILGVLSLAYFSKELRNLLILKVNKINIFSFYFFLYLCTFKILPLAIFIKLTYVEILKKLILN